MNSHTKKETAQPAAIVTSERNVTLVEHPFVSDLPLVGGFVARFREAWNNVSTKWYVRPLLRQQNEINQLLLQSIQLIESQLHQLDRELVSAAHDKSEITAQIAQMNRLLESIDSRLARLESLVASQPEE